MGTSWKNIIFGNLRPNIFENSGPCVHPTFWIFDIQKFEIHIATQPHSHIATQPHSHIATQPYSHIATQLHSHRATQPHSYIATKEAACGRLHKGAAAFGRRPFVDFLCGYVAMWLCGSVAMQLCSYVAIWLCGYVAMWLCGYVAALGEPPQGCGGTAGPTNPDRSLFLTVRTPRQAWLGKNEIPEILLILFSVN